MTEIVHAFFDAVGPYVIWSFAAVTVLFVAALARESAHEIFGDKS